MRVQLQLSGLHVTVLAVIYDKGQVVTTGHEYSAIKIRERVHLRMFSAAFEPVYAIHLFATGFFSDSVIPTRFPEMDPRPLEICTIVLVCFLSKSGRNVLVTRNVPTTLTLRICSYVDPDLQARHNQQSDSRSWLVPAFVLVMN